MLIKEKDGSLTVNCQQGGSMSTRSYGMVGKSYKTASEAFKDAEYATGIEMPQKAEYNYLWAILGCLAAIGLVVWVSMRF